MTAYNLPANAGDIRDMGSIPGSGNPLEEGMATHSSILAWRVPMDRGVWQAMVHTSQRVGHDWSDLAHMYPIPQGCRKDWINNVPKALCTWLTYIKCFIDVHFLPSFLLSHISEEAPLPGRITWGLFVRNDTQQPGPSVRKDGCIGDVHLFRTGHHVCFSSFGML